METNFLHKIEYNQCKSLLKLAHCERNGYSLLCTNDCFYGPDQPILTDAGRGKACFIHKLEQCFSNFLMLQHTNTFWIWLRHTYFMKSKTYFPQTLQWELLIIRFCQNIKLLQHTSASSAAHSLQNTELEHGVQKFCQPLEVWKRNTDDLLKTVWIKLTIVIYCFCMKVCCKSIIASLHYGWIHVDVQNTVKYGWKSSKLFYPEKLFYPFTCVIKTRVFSL